jgi:hypothetical protein
MVRSAGRTVRCTAIAFLFIVAAASMAAAQRAEVMPPADGANRQARPLSPAEIAGMLDSYAAVRAQDALSLDEAHYAEFVTRLRKLQEVRRRNQQGLKLVLQVLRKLAGAQAEPPYDEAAIRERLKALREHDDRAAAELRRAYDAVDETLDARQQARFRIFEETIERRKLDLLMRARDGAARKRNIQP